MTISADTVKTLRERTGVGIMDCKSALTETDGDIDKAIELLRKMGVASAEKRVGRETNQGLVEAYIHAGSQLGVLVEINCETDFVAKTDDFKNFARDIAMQVAATGPRVVSRKDFPQEDIDKELEIYKTQANNEGKPENIIERFVQGKLEKFYQENALMEQSYIKDPSKNIKELLAEVITKTGENINIRKFVRYQLGS
ncbi:translation elongation factor Ts [candidate division KSB1 bacterium]|nr:translation elongation factor Ts [candidate division KSB1 bacterium]